MEDIANSLTTWSRVLENIIMAQVVKKFHAFLGTQRFIAVFTRVIHISLS
jgi:hypothetical protein